MPMGGGTFTVQNKTLPGSYINFVSMSSAAAVGERGITALPLELNWGPEGQMISVAAEEFPRKSMELLGYESAAPELLLVREALKRASKLLLYRINGGGDKASATVGGLTATARYGGVRGNDLKVAVLSDVDHAERVDVVTYLDGAELDRQNVAASGGAGLKDNAFVSFVPGDTLSAAAAAPLTGGTNGAVNGSAYTAWLTALEVEAFHTVGYPGTDEGVKALVAAFVQRLRDEDGRKVVGVLYQYAGDSVGLINVKNGVVLSGGRVLSGDKAVCWVAGAAAGAQVNQSLTNAAYDGAVDVDVKYTTSQYEAALKAGEFVFYADGGRARVLSDINSRTTFSGGVSEDWTSNRVVRVMDGWANDVARIFGQRYLGAQTNSETGRTLFKADLVSLGSQYEAMEAISGFSADDITVAKGTGKRDVAVECALQPSDSMEKLYMTVAVN